jgi:hypothetical protein
MSWLVAVTGARCIWRGTQAQVENNTKSVVQSTAYLCMDFKTLGLMGIASKQCTVVSIEGRQKNSGERANFFEILDNPPKYWLVSHRSSAVLVPERFESHVFQAQFFIDFEFRFYRIPVHETDRPRKAGHHPLSRRGQALAREIPFSAV